MRLTISNLEAYSLARELAQVTGQSMTAVVIEALRQQRRQVVNQRRKEIQMQELMAIAERCAAHLRHPTLAAEHGAMLYHEKGLP